MKTAKYRLCRLNIGYCLSILGILLSRQAMSQCANATIQNISSAAGKCKVGFTEFCDPSVPPRYYLMEQNVDSGNWSEMIDSNTTYMGQINWSASQTMDRFSEIVTITATGSCTKTTTGGMSSTCTTSVTGADYSGQYLNEVTWDDLPCADNSYWYFPFAFGESADCTETCTANTITIAATSGPDDGFTGGGSYTATLSTEYTDGMVQEDVKSLLPDFSGDWQNGSGVAFFLWNDDNHTCASGGQMEYRFAVTDCQTHDSYIIKWDEVTTTPDGTVSMAGKQEEVSGDGDPTSPIYSSIHTVNMPETPSSITEANVTITESDQSDPGD